MFERATFSSFFEAIMYTTIGQNFAFFSGTSYIVTGTIYEISTLEMGLRQDNSLFPNTPNSFCLKAEFSV